MDDERALNELWASLKRQRANYKELKAASARKDATIAELQKQLQNGEGNIFAILILQSH